ncbi:MAG: AtpZ/AtpI family protein [Sphaerospermopsis kisseleviana]
MARQTQRFPFGDALAWSSRIMEIGLAMGLPAVAGRWLDVRLGTGWWAVAGLVLGFAAGMAWVVQLARRKRL